MAGYDLGLRIAKGFHEEAKAFFDFLRQAARLHHVALSVRKVKDSEYCATLDGTPGAKVDAFLQELMMSRALYYYACGIKNRRRVAAKVIAPIFQQLLESRFAITHKTSLRRHILGTMSNELVPSDMLEPFAHKYDGLFRKWDLRMITDYDFVRDLDDLLTDFMLTHLGHKTGDKSPQFNVLVGNSGRANIVFEKETRKAFIRIHELRTRGLHRLEKTMNLAEISRLAVSIYLYFQYFDEFSESQRVKMITLKGKRYRRLKYGEEELKYVNRRDLRFAARHKQWADAELPCHDCHAIKGQYHCDHCDVERCPRCFNQLLSCGCPWGADDEERRNIFGIQD
jgi:hypothetical protein